MGDIGNLHQVEDIWVLGVLCKRKSNDRPRPRHPCASLAKRGNRYGAERQEFIDIGLFGHGFFAIEGRLI